MKCNKCGREIEDNATFCPYCGEKVEMEISSEVVEEKKEEEMINPIIPTVGFGIAIGLYVASFLLIKLNNYLVGFADYLIFLFLVPLGIGAMVLTAFGRHCNSTRGVKVISWVSMGVLILDYIMLFAACIAAIK